MSARKKRWVLRDPAPPEVRAALHAYPPLIATLLYQRGHRSADSAEAFLATNYPQGLHDPFRLKGMDAAVQRLAAAIQQGEPIAVYGDFDADGVTAVALLMQAIGAMGGDIRPYVPHRIREGYGMNNLAIERLAADGVRLLVTVDCGISNATEVAHARALGVDVIVTDHHTPPDDLPDAVAIINPKQPGCQYPYKQLVGVGLAFKLVQALHQRGLRLPLRARALLDVVALGTVADMGPLTGENRVLVRAGLEALNATQRPGLQALIGAAGLTPGRITTDDISFALAPRLNAAGRLDDAVLAYQLLLAEDVASAQPLAAALNQANRQRQDLTTSVQDAARRQAGEQGKLANRIVLLDGAEYVAGVAGLVAARLAEEFGRPVLVVERGEATSRGSARSVPGFNIFAALDSCRELFVRFGGHSAAAGFTIANELLPELDARLQAYAAGSLEDGQLLPVLEIHAESPLADLSWELLQEIDRLEPFGAENPRPVFISRRVRVAGAWPRGADGQHLKLRLDDGRGGPAYDAIAFRLGRLAEHFPRHPWIDIAYTLEAHEWNGTRTLRLNIKDLRRA
jgi:single-stranded-DNA-specific exonuclease